MATRNKVEHHGILGIKPDGRLHYASVPVELARDPELSATASRVALYVWSHSAEFRQSAADVAKNLNMHRDTVARALAELQRRGWLVREVTTRPGMDKPSAELWHLQMTNTPFTADQIKELNGVELPSDTPSTSGKRERPRSESGQYLPKDQAGHDDNLPKNQAPPCLGIRQVPAYGLGNIVVDSSSLSSKKTGVVEKDLPNLEHPVADAPGSGLGGGSRFCRCGNEMYETSGTREKCGRCLKGHCYDADASAYH